jgi:hypothetical protein
MIRKARLERGQTISERDILRTYLRLARLHRGAAFPWVYGRGLIARKRQIVAIISRFKIVRVDEKSLHFA